MVAVFGNFMDVEGDDRLVVFLLVLGSRPFAKRDAAKHSSTAAEIIRLGCIRDNLAMPETYSTGRLFRGCRLRRS